MLAKHIKFGIDKDNSHTGIKIIYVVSYVYYQHKNILKLFGDIVNCQSNLRGRTRFCSVSYSRPGMLQPSQHLC
jgi:hypothetical protein